jgi:hypothetical protein
MSFLAASRRQASVFCSRTAGRQLASAAAVSSARPLSTSSALRRDLTSREDRFLVKPKKAEATPTAKAETAAAPKGEPTLAQIISDSIEVSWEAHTFADSPPGNRPHARRALHAALPHAPDTGLLLAGRRLWQKGRLYHFAGNQPDLWRGKNDPNRSRPDSL